MLMQEREKMLSLTTRAFIRLIRTFNINPCKNPDWRKKMVREMNLMTNESVRPSYVYKKKKTSSGIRYYVLTYKKARSNSKVIYFIHGGAFVYGIINLYKNFLYPFARKGYKIILIDYDLVPEYVYPTQLIQCYDLYEEIVKKHDPSKIILGGDSAGGNLVLSLLLRLRDNRRPLPLKAFLISPWADMKGTGKSYYTNYGKDPIMGEYQKELTAKKAEYLKRSDLYDYVGKEARDNPYVSPCYGDYHDFCPLYFSAGGDEMLLDDTLSCVKKAREAQVPVTLDEVPYMFHTFVLYRDYFSEAKEAHKRLMKWVEQE